MTIERIPPVVAGKLMGGPEELRERTKRFALRIFKLFRSLPKSDEGRILGKQLLRSGTSVTANYRAVCRARSRDEFVAKMGVVIEEADETLFWLEFLRDTAWSRDTASRVSLLKPMS